MTLRAKPIPADGFYGATLELYDEPSYYIDQNDIIITLSPLGMLIEGSTYSVVNDIPLGKYTVTETYSGTPLKLKKLDSDQF